MRPVNLRGSKSNYFAINRYAYVNTVYNLISLFGDIYFMKKEKIYFIIKPKTDDLYHMIPKREGIIEKFVLQICRKEIYL